MIFNKNSEDKKPIFNFSGSQIKSFFLNKDKSEFIETTDIISFDRIPVTGLTDKHRSTLLETLREHLPSSLNNYFLLHSPIPPTESHSIQFIQELNGEAIKFVHIFSIDCKFRAEFANIVKDGDTENYPAYETNYLFFKSQIIPVEEIFYENNAISNFKPLQLFNQVRVESDQYFHTFALFDESGNSDLSDLILKTIPHEIFSFSPKTYHFISYSHLTACFNTSMINSEQLETAVRYYEPLLIKIFSSLETPLANKNFTKFDYSKYFTDKQNYYLTPDFTEKLKNYFAHYELYSDNSLSLKRWKKINVKI